MAFPAGFGWGAATAAYQVEGRRSIFPFPELGWIAFGDFLMSGKERVLGAKKRRRRWIEMSTWGSQAKLLFVQKVFILSAVFP